MFGDFKDFKIINTINQFNISSKKTLRNKSIILCIPSTLIHYFNNKIKSKSIYLGAQNCHHHQGGGSFTGSINSLMLKNAGAKYVILGHSENRAEGESDKIIKKKIISSLQQNLNIIFCIGEKTVDKNKNKTFSILKKQIRNSLDKKLNFNKIIIAYEPVWSIGSNKIPKMDELNRTIKFIKSYLKKNFKMKNIPKVLYGGSVNNKNISLFSSITELDGFLIGRASQSAKKFIDIIRNYYK